MGDFLMSLNGPWRNDACLGYAAKAMARTGLDEATIEAVLNEMSDLFDVMSVEEAAGTEGTGYEF